MNLIGMTNIKHPYHIKDGKGVVFVHKKVRKNCGFVQKEKRVASVA